MLNSQNGRKRPAISLFKTIPGFSLRINNNIISRVKIFIFYPEYGIIMLSLFNLIVDSIGIQILVRDRIGIESRASPWKFRVIMQAFPTIRNLTRAL